MQVKLNEAFSGIKFKSAHWEILRKGTASDYCNSPLVLESVGGGGGGGGGWPSDHFLVRVFVLEDCPENGKWPAVISRMLIEDRVTI